MINDVTLSEGIRAIGDDDTEQRIKRKLIVLHMLSNVQQNLMVDIQNILNEKGKYKYTIKHNHKQIMDLIRHNAAKGIFANFSDKTLDLYMEDFEELEEMILSWAEAYTPDKEVEKKI